MASIIEEFKYITLKNYYSWKEFFAYRTQAIIWLIYGAFSTIISIVTISVIYTISSGIGGWSYYQILLLTASSNIFFGLVFYFIDPGWLTSKMLQGQLDMDLTKPYSKFSVLFASTGFPGLIGSSISGLILFVYSAYHLQATIAAIIGYIAMFVFGTVAFTVFLLMFIVAIYHLIKRSSFVNRALGLAQRASFYPLSVYGRLGVLIFSVLLPIGIAYYYPSTTFLGRISPSLYAIIILFSIIVVLVSYVLLNLLMKTYVSGGG